MCRFDTIRFTVALALGLAATVCAAWAQDVARPQGLPEPGWQHIGNAAVELGLASVATGPVVRVWYSADGARLFALAGSGRVFTTSDFEQWSEAAGINPPVVTDAPATRVPDPRAKVRGQDALAGRLYALAGQVWRSDDGGASWTGVTEFQGRSILGGPATDLAVSPRDPGEVTVANAEGVWRSLDAGISWTGLNQFLPNLGIGRLLATPAGSRGVTMAAGRDTASAYEWAPGEKSAWRPVRARNLETELALRAGLSRTLGATITAAAAAGDFVYAGSSDGRLWSSSDQGRTWRPSGNAGEAPAVEAIVVNPKEPGVALAALGARTIGVGTRAVHIRRTINGGIFWDDLTSNLPDAAAWGVAADPVSGAIYAATDAGVFFTMADLSAAGPATSWSAVPGLPKAPAVDVRLDPNGNQLWVAVDGYGVYSTLAPHRFRDVRVVNAADYSARAAAPGSLLTVLGARIESARSADMVVPVLNASQGASQIQVPFEVTGTALSLTLQSDSRRLNETIALQTVSPAIFVDPDGAPLLLDAESGVLLDTMRPAHSGSRIQILATGLGRVKPDWPTGLAAPIQNPPQVIAPVRAWLDREPAEVTQAVLAPGYVGFYLIEVELPRIVNAGPAELYVEAGGKMSNRVRVYIEP